MEFLVLFLIGIGGVVLHIVAQFRKGITLEPKNGRKFNERFLAVWANFDLLGNVFYAAFAIVFVVAITGLRDELAELLPVTKLSILFYGYFADSAFKNLTPKQLQ